MTDIKELLDGTVEDVKAGLSGLDATTLAEVLAAEQAGKNRKGAIDAIEEAQTEASAGSDVSGPAMAVTTVASLDHSPAADIAPATSFESSGAPVQSSGFDLDHDALDANPRANTTANQNRIDFNDPVSSGF